MAIRFNCNKVFFLNRIFLCSVFVLITTNVYSAYENEYKRDTLTNLFQQEKFKPDYYYSVLLESSLTKTNIIHKYRFVKELNQGGFYNYIQAEYVDIDDAFLQRKKMASIYPKSKVVLIKNGVIIKRLETKGEIIYESAFVEETITKQTYVNNTVLQTSIYEGDINHVTEYSIQIFASIYDKNVSDFNLQNVYMMYIDGMYKFRVGRYDTYTEANNQLNNIKNKGFPQAFVVGN